MDRQEPSQRAGRVGRVTAWLSRDVPNGVSLAFWTAAGAGVAVVAALGLQVVTIHPFHWGFLANAFLIVLAVELVLGLVCFAFTRRAEKAARCAVAIAMLVLWWAGFTSLTESIGQEHIAGVVTAVIAGSVGYAILRFGRETGIILLFGIVVGGAVVMAVVQAQSPGMSDQALGSIVESVEPDGDSPDLLVIVLDGYARDDTLREVFSTDNVDFQDELTDIGFVVNHRARSNYNRTYASLSSMLALDTVITADGDTEQELSVMRSVAGGDGEFLRAFKRAGYSVTFSPAIWPGSYCGSVVDTCVEIGITQHNIYWLLRTSLLAPIASRLMAYPWSAASWTRITNLADIHLDSRSAGPTVTWIHVALPHPPVTRGDGCELYRDQWRQVLGLTTGGGEDQMRLDAFAEQTACIDSVVIDQIRAVLEADPDTAILLLSDHGPDGQLQTLTALDEHTPEQIHEKLAVLLAFRGPDRCNEVVRLRSTVAIMRGVTRCMLNASVDGSSTASYLVPHEEEIAVGVRPLILDEQLLP